MCMCCVAVCVPQRAHEAERALENQFSQQCVSWGPNSGTCIIDAYLKNLYVCVAVWYTCAMYARMCPGH